VLLMNWCSNQLPSWHSLLLSFGLKRSSISTVLNKCQCGFFLPFFFFFSCSQYTKLLGESIIILAFPRVMLHNMLNIISGYFLS